MQFAVRNLPCTRQSHGCHFRPVIPTRSICLIIFKISLDCLCKNLSEHTFSIQQDHKLMPLILSFFFFILPFFPPMKRLYYSISLTQICLLKWPKIHFGDYFWSIIFVFQSRPFRNRWCWWQTPPFEVFTRYNLFTSVFPHTVLM